MVFNLPLQQTEGFLRSLADLLELELPIPDHTTLSRRLRKLGEIRFRRFSTNRPIHLLIDSASLRIHVGRSMVENAVYRYIIGRRMRSRSLAGQRAEVKLACGILNTMTKLGMPESHRVK